MALVMGVDLLEPSSSLPERGEAEHALAVGQVRTRARVLHDGWLPARQVAQRAVADPGILKTHAGRLGRAELTTRPLDVGAVGLGAARDLSRVTHPPAMLLEAHPVLRVLHSLLEACLALRIAIEEAQRELEGLIRVAGQVHELEKRDPLRVVEEDGLPILIHLEPARGGPAGDSREGVGPVIMGDGPEVEAHGRTEDRKSTRLNSSHSQISYAVFCLKNKKQ